METNVKKNGSWPIRPSLTLVYILDEIPILNADQYDVQILYHRLSCSITKEGIFISRAMCFNLTLSHE